MAGDEPIVTREPSRRRRATLRVAALVVVGLVVVASALVIDRALESADRSVRVGSGDASREIDTGREIDMGGVGFVVPSSWHVDESGGSIRSQVFLDGPDPRPPAVVAATVSFEALPDSSCGQIPVAPLTAISDRGAMFALDTASFSGTVHTLATTPHLLEDLDLHPFPSDLCDDPATGALYGIFSFTKNDTYFIAHVGLGRDASERVRSELQSVRSSLHTRG
jgi:hypothetical protein